MGLNLQGFAVSFKTKKPDVFAFHMSIEMPTNHETLDFERATSPSIEDN